MDMSSFGNFHHVGAIVKDMDKAIAGLATVGVKPTGGMPGGGDVAEMHFTGEFKGKATEWGVKICMLKMGELDIELLQPTGGFSILQEFIDEGKEGVHHVAYIVEDVEKETAALVAQGCKVLTKGTGKKSFYYLETGGGIIIELRG